MPEPFSLLLPVYAGDRPEFLAAAFSSTVTDQERRPDEVVIVRDGPVGSGLTETLTRIRDTSPVPLRLVESERNVGLARALDLGLEAVSHEIVARMDADDISYPSRFAVQLPVVEAGADVVGSAMHEFVEVDGAARVVGTRTPPLTAEAIAAQLPFHNPFNHPTVVFRRSAVARAGGYQPLGTMEDYWLFGRLVADGARTANVADPLLRYRVSSGAYTRRGGWGLFRTELALQRAFRRRRITTRTQFARNVVVRGGYRFIPGPIRQRVYRRVFVATDA